MAGFEARYDRLWAAVRAKDEKALGSFFGNDFSVFTLKGERRSGADAFRDGIAKDIAANPRSTSEVASVNETSGFAEVTYRSVVDAEGLVEPNEPKRVTVVWEDLWAKQKRPGLLTRADWILLQRSQMELTAILGSGREMRAVRPPDPEPPVDGVLVVAQIWEHIEPYARGDRYEDPLQTFLVAKGLGVVTGGGTQLGNDAPIEFVNVEMSVRNVEQSVPKIAAELERLGAPNDSELRYSAGGEERVVPFGRSECLAIFLDGVNLPKEVYANADVNAVISRLNAALQGSVRGELRSHWEGPRETALFYYGENAAAMHTALQPVMERSALCQNARVVERYGRPSA